MKGFELRKPALASLVLVVCFSTYSRADEGDNHSAQYQVEGKYNNPVYGFSVIVPDNLIAYSLQLETDQAHLQEDKKVFDQVTASFKKTARQ